MRTRDRCHMPLLAEGSAISCAIASVAKQSSFSAKAGLLRRFAFCNDGV
jgi:hypothetical protein